MTNALKPIDAAKRKFLTAKSLVSLSLFAAATLALAAEEPLKVHFISGAKEYRSEASLREFEKLLEGEHGMEVTASWVSDGAKELPEIDEIAKADVLLVYARRLKLPDDQMEKVRAHWEAGKPVVGIRTASHAFSDEENETFDKKVMGGNYAGHFGNEPVTVTATAAGKTHPVLEGVGEIGRSSRLYKAGDLADGAVVLQTGGIGEKDARQPVTWTHTYSGGRNFYTSLGVPDDFADEDFLNMLVNAIRWVAEEPSE